METGEVTLATGGDCFRGRRILPRWTTAEAAGDEVDGDGEKCPSETEPAGEWPAFGMASPARQRGHRRLDAAKELALPDDILAEVLIRLPTLADIGRACAVCSSFRRVVAGAAFLRRVRALHPPALLGFYGLPGRRFHPAQAPHPSAPAARAVLRAADFGFSFLPSPRSWIVRDVLDGRFLLGCQFGEDGGGIYEKLAVCDPLFRRHLLLPPIPEDLAASVCQPRRVASFFAPTGEEQPTAAAADETSFKVIWIAQCPDKPVCFVFSSVTGQWRAIASPSWSDLSPAFSHSAFCSLFWRRRSYAYGCFYWLMGTSGNLLVLDMCRMDFSVLKLPSNPSRHFILECAVVEAGEGKLGLFALRRSTPSYALELYSKAMQNEGKGASKWSFDSAIMMPSLDEFCVLGVTGRELFLQVSPSMLGCYSLEFSTNPSDQKLEFVRGLIDGRQQKYVFAAAPPHRSAPFAHALARAANFRFSFLPSYPSAQWIVRDGRVLLDSDDDGRVFTKLAVCDPVFRRHLLLPPIPPDLAASVEKPHALDLNRKSEVFLAPSGEDGAAAETSFRVIWMAQCPTKLVAAVFSSAIGEWVAVAAPNWGDLKPSKSYTERRVLFCRSYAYGCFYWMMSISPHLLVFDLSKMEFSVLKLPSGHSGQESAIVEIREGKIGMFALRGYMAQRELDLFSTVRGNEGDGEWRLENKAILPYQYSYCLLGAANGELVLQGTLEYVDDDFLEPNLGYLSLKFSNLQCERVCRMVDEYMVSPPFLYIGSPPSLLPQITVLLKLNFLQLLEEVFLRLPNPADLARASMACTSFRRLITAHAFLRRFRRLHPPPLLGILGMSFLAAQPPHLSAAAARAFADPDAADFSCSFIPSSDRWCRRDLCDGRCLLSAVPEGSDPFSARYDRHALVKSFAVCDPLYRRYILLPAIPDDLAALVNQGYIVDFEPEEDTMFRVICLAQCETKLVAFIYSRGAGQWHAVEFGGWRDLTRGTSNRNPSDQTELYSRYYAHGCFFWVMNWLGKLLVLDTRSYEFSYIDLPPGPKPEQMVIVEAVEGKLGLFALCFDPENGLFCLIYAILENDDSDTLQWCIKFMLPLHEHHHYGILGVAGGYLLLMGIPSGSRSNYICFSLNVRTFELEWFCRVTYGLLSPPLYAGRCAPVNDDELHKFKIPVLGPEIELACHLLEEVFVLLPTAADLARASMACASFRRLITAHAFLRRFRRLHPPPLLGILSAGFLAAQPPHPSAAAARAFADPDAVDFFCSFIPSRDQWHRRDFRDGRSLLSANPEGSDPDRLCHDPRALVKSFAVCDPLYRRYILLPAIPDDLAALVNQSEIAVFEPFLCPAAEGEEERMFRVICLAQCEAKLVAFIYSRTSGHWHAVEFDGWSDLTRGTSNPYPSNEPELSRRCYAHGCFCWIMHWVSKFLVFNTRRLEFSSVNVPPEHPLPNRAIVEAVEGKLGLFTLYCDFENAFLYYAILQNDDKGTLKWCLKEIIPLHEKYNYNIMGAAGGYLLLQGFCAENVDRRPTKICLSLNVRTFEVEQFCETTYLIISPSLYVGFPPSLSPPTI
uniref:F-box domain-containing protein n=1 Tax=Leersia perrieri TaxID=77586 RepID=A0A0D9X072_9ORYZ